MINFYFVLVCYASFYFFCKYEANLKIVEPKRKRKYLARYMEDAPPPSWMLSWSFLSVQKLCSSRSGCSNSSEECASDGWRYS